MEDDRKQFEIERESCIAKQGNNAEFRNCSDQWLVESYKLKYSYNFKWMGLPIIQYPQDIMMMQELVWEVKPDLIIETGVARGGSIIFYSSILELIGNGGKVLGIDIDIRKHNRDSIENHPLNKNVHLIEGCSIEETTMEKVRNFITNGSFKNVLVSLDSYHSYEHVLKELILYSEFVKKGSYIVAFDTLTSKLTDELSAGRPWTIDHNPKTAVFDFLEQNDRFEVDNNIDNKLMISSNPYGYLRCVR